MNNEQPIQTGIDSARIEQAVTELLLAIGEDPTRDGLVNTPARVARAYQEIFAGIHADPAEVLTTNFDLGHEELVLVKGIEFHSVCEHHLLPFFGVAHIAYLPGFGGKITGLSKLARVVDLFAKRPQVQERLTTQIADAIEGKLQPAGVVVILEAQHLCMSMRGIKKTSAITVTSTARGSLKEEPARSEVMNLIRSS
ncbi:MAG: GTP cyclohydrolase I FolE [Actinobacteria bacterium]|jgi:GTP cyclohydrolase I|uniref:GTP cyclohydrolase I n=1 Tax=freshwater metagenome TaxID=449393 RepID=A0A6J6EA85_9ZZZZ|nr:GTP cyclohydrolase I FolE [Actinomycetota bacterium]